MKTPNFFYNKSSIVNKILPIFVFIEWLYVVIFSAIYFIKKEFSITPKIRTICVGNSVCGGSGKTEIANLIAKILQKNGHTVAFVTKGYRRSSVNDIFIKKNQEISDQSYKNLSDEPILLSKIADVFIVKSRKNFIKNFSSQKYDFLVMDDGLSSPSIKHFMSFLLFDNLRFSGNDRFLPFGPKRIPLFLLKKLISMIVATNIDNQTINSDIKDLSQNYFNLSSTCSTEIITECNIDENDKFLAFSGLGINEKFFFSLRKHGVNLIKTIEFPDHHFYEIDDLNKISEIAKKFNINRIITTSKDFVKLPKQWIEKNRIVEFKILHESNDLEKFILNKINI